MISFDVYSQQLVVVVFSLCQVAPGSVLEMFLDCSLKPTREEMCGRA